MIRRFYLALCLLLIHSAQAVALPIAAADTVTIENRVWAQPDLFIGFSWYEVSQLCPFLSPVCIPGSSLNGHDLTGWTWARGGDMQELFNRYLLAAGYGPGELLGDDTDTVQRSLPAPDFAELFFADFRLTTNVNGNRPGVSGWQSALLSSPPITASRIYRHDGPSQPSIVAARTNEVRQGVLFPSPHGGAWFFRDTPGSVPLPSSFTLLGLALAILIAGRRR